MSALERPKASLWKQVIFFVRKHLRPGTVSIAKTLKVHVDAGLPEDVRRWLYKEQYEYPELQLARLVLKPGDRVMEAGCGIGVVGVACAAICGSGNVTSYEANPRLADRIRRNFALNGLIADLRVEALATYEGETEIHLDDDIVSSSVLAGTQGEVTTVPCDDIAKIVREIRPNVIVMDVEGAETDLLPHADLSGVDKVLLELHPAIVGQDAVDRLLEGLSKRGLQLRPDLSLGSVVYLERSMPDVQTA